MFDTEILILCEQLKNEADAIQHYTRALGEEPTAALEIDGAGPR